MATCPHCENEIDDGARFCGVCGRPITQTAEAAARAATSASSDVSGSRHAPPPSAVPTQIPVTPSTPASGPAPAPLNSSPNVMTMNRSGPSPRPAPAARPAPAPAASPPAPIRGPAQPLENLIGRTLNHRYIVEDKIGEGGFGAVFRGKQIATGREVALKILHPHNVHDETIVARFRREAEACSKLRDPHTVTTYDFDETPDGILYLAMELLRGRALHHLQKADGPLGATRVLRILDQVAASLTEAHANGIVHRDMKPENVFIEIARRRGPRQGARLRHRQGDVRRSPGARADSGRPDAGDAGVHVARAAARAEAGRPLGHLRPRHDGLRDADRKAALSERQDADRHHQLPHEARRRRCRRSWRITIAIPAAVDAIIVKMVQKDRENRFADATALREEIARAQRSMDRTPDKFEAYRLFGVVGAVVIVIATLIFFLRR